MATSGHAIWRPRAGHDAGPRRGGHLALLISALWLGACSFSSSSGGSSGDGAGDHRSPSFFETVEYQASYALAALNASSAYATGVSGRGITVGVIDTGIDRDHPEFAGAIAAASTDIVSGNPNNLDDRDGHGTAVAGVLAARRNGALSHGVAYEAQILAVRADTGGSCATGCVFNQAHVAAATDYAAARGARVINYSLGGASVLDPSLSGALRRAAAGGAVLVLAAGNDGGAEPTLPARFAGTSEAGGRAIAVGAVDAGNRLLGFSNQAGGTAEYFLVAPGDRVLAPALGGGGALVTGTSFATPHVSGAAALILEAAPFLRAEQVVALLLDTATDLGAPGTDPEYGRGLVNLAAALSPQGKLSVPLGAIVEADLAPLDGSSLQLGPAFGPGPALGRAIFLDGYGRPYWLELDQRVGTRSSAPDLLAWLAPGRARHSFATTVGPNFGLRLELAVHEEEPAAPVAPWLDPDRGERQRLALSMDLGTTTRLSLSRGYGLQGQFGLSGAAGASAPGLLGGRTLASPYLAMADQGEGMAVEQRLGRDLTMRLGLASEQGESDDPLERGATRVMVGELIRQWDAGSHLGVQLGSVEETAGVLESGGGGAFALGDGATTRFLGLNGRLALGARLALFGQASFGLTEPGPSAQGLMRDLSVVQSAGFAAGLSIQEVSHAGDRLILAIAQPLRAIGGTATLDRPVSRTFDGRIVRQTEEVSLVPEGREVDLEIGYQVALDRGRTLAVNWLTQLQPGHDPDAAPAHALAVKLGARF